MYTHPSHFLERGDKTFKHTCYLWYWHDNRARQYIFKFGAADVFVRGAINADFALHSGTAV